MPGKPGFKGRIEKTHIHISVPRYLMRYVERLARAHNTSRGYEISVCILLRYLNDSPSSLENNKNNNKV